VIHRTDAFKIFEAVEAPALLRLKLPGQVLSCEVTRCVFDRRPPPGGTERSLLRIGFQPFPRPLFGRCWICQIIGALFGRDFLRVIDAVLVAGGAMFLWVSRAQRPL
jgi:hypothetical protein